MSKKFLIYLSLALFTCTSIQPIYSYSYSNEAYEGKKVANIELTMENLPFNASFDQKVILAKMKTKKGDPFSQLTFDADLKMLAQEYDRVEPHLDMHNGQVSIILKIFPRPTIRSIKWEGNHHVKTSALRSELNVKAHRPFNRQTFNKSLTKVKEYYIKKGYFESQVYYTSDIDPKTNEIDVTIHIKEGRSGKIQNILFRGFTKKERSDVLQMVYTRKYNLLLSWLTGEGIYNEEALDQDQLVIINYLQNKGYADAKVNIAIEEKDNGKIVIIINADRGPVFHFGKLTFDGNQLFTDKQIENVFTVHPGEIYSPDNLRATAQAIKDLYGRKGYIEANVQYEVILAEDAPIYNVDFVIDEGKQYKIGVIHIFGNVQTQQRIILRESLLVPGETFDMAKLKATQRRLQNMGFFKNVNVYAVRTADDTMLGEDYRDVYIEVEETITGNISLSFGLSTADSAFGSLDFTETNFNIGNLATMFKKGFRKFRGGGEYAHAKVVVGEKQRTYGISWMDPYFKDTLWRIGFDGTSNWSHLQSKHYEINTLSLTLYDSYPLTSYWTFGSRYRLRHSWVNFSHGATEKEKHEAGQHGMISGFGASLNYDSTDSAIKPHNGYRSLLEADVTGFGGHFTFARLGYINTYYRNLWKGGILKCRFDFRFIEPFWKTSKPDDIPLSERYFLGGEGSVRGYKPFDIGPHFSNGDPTGGITSSLLSIEYLHELFNFLDVFVFFDAGSISMKRFHIEKYNVSYGYGIRVDLMNRMPITLGMGYPVNPDRHSEVRRFFFSMGGQF